MPLCDVEAIQPQLPACAGQRQPPSFFNPGGKFSTRQFNRRRTGSVPGQKIGYPVPHCIGCTAQGYSFCTPAGAAQVLDGGVCARMEDCNFHEIGFYVAMNLTCMPGCSKDGGRAVGLNSVISVCPMMCQPPGDCSG